MTFPVPTLFPPGQPYGAAATSCSLWQKSGAEGQRCALAFDPALGEPVGVAACQ
jgi:hypothetical protein